MGAAQCGCCTEIVCQSNWRVVSPLRKPSLLSHEKLSPDGPRSTEIGVETLTSQPRSDEDEPRPGDLDAGAWGRYRRKTELRQPVTVERNSRSRISRLLLGVCREHEKLRSQPRCRSAVIQTSDLKPDRPRSQKTEITRRRQSTSRARSSTRSTQRSCDTDSSESLRASAPNNQCRSHYD